MSITPILLKEQEIPGKDITEMWSGNEAGFSLSEPFHTAGGSGAGEWFTETPEAMTEGAVSELPDAKRPQPAEKKVEPGPQDATDRTDQASAVSTPGQWPDTIPYSIHVNSFPTLKEAEHRIRELTGLGYDCFMVLADVPGKGTYYRIFVGGFEDYSSARTTCDDFKGRNEFADDIHPVTRKWAFTGYKG